MTKIQYSNLLKLVFAVFLIKDKFLFVKCYLWRYNFKEELSWFNEQRNRICDNLFALSKFLIRSTIFIRLKDGLFLQGPESKMWIIPTSCGRISYV